MNLPRSSLAAIAAAVLCALAPAGVATDPLVPQRMMVRAETPTKLGAFVAAAAQTFDDVAVIDAIDGRPIHMLRYRLRAGQDDNVASRFCDAQVALGVATWAELNYAGQTGEGRTDSFWISQFGLDPGLFANQYGGGTIGLPAARGWSQGEGTLIAVLDTGIDASHPAFEGRVLPGGASFIAGAGTQDEPDETDNDGDGLVDEQWGHGTFVAGIVHLTAPRAWLLPVTVLDSDGVGDLWTIAKGMAFAMDRGADVINMSLGSTYSSALLEDLANQASSRGIVVAAALGNMGRQDPEEFPAALGTALAVCATDPDDLLATFSNFNPKADLSAPGSTTTVAGMVVHSRAVVGPVPGNGWAAWQGTSFATAFAAGTAALVRAQHPDWPSAAVPRSAIDERIVEDLSLAAAPIDDLNPDYEGLIGSGRLSAASAVFLAPPAPKEGDLDLDGAVNGADLGLLLGAFGGPCGSNCRADLNRDGNIDGADLGRLLGNWG